MQNTINEIFNIAITEERKSLLEMVLKCSEEIGELSEAVLSFTQAPGCEYKKLQISNVKEEVTDIIIVALAIAAKIEMSQNELNTIMKNKVLKWRQKIKI